MGIRVGTRRSGHKVHERGRPPAGVKLVRRRRTPTLVGRIGVGHVPVDAAARGEAANEDDGTVGECFGTRVPAHVLHGEHGRVVEPLALWRRQVVLCARIEYSDGLSAIVVAVDSILVRGILSGRGVSFYISNKGRGHTDVMAILAQMGTAKADETDVVTVLEWGTQHDPCNGGIATYPVVKALCTFFAMHRLAEFWPV